MSQLKTLPPPFVPPKEKEVASNPAYKKNLDVPLQIRYVEDIDMMSLAINIVSFGLVLIVLAVLSERLFANWIAVAAISLSGIWILGVSFRDRLGITVPAREAQVYLNPILSRNIIVYTQGFHFTAWFYRKEKDSVSFQKHEIIEASQKEKSEIVFPSSDGNNMVAELEIMFCRREGGEAMSKSLKFPLDQIKSWTRARVVAMITEAGGQNSFETMRYYKSDVMAWVSTLFGRPDEISSFEDELGITVKPPVLKNLDLTEESKKVFINKSKIAILKDGIMELTDKDNGAGLTPTEANYAIQAMEGAITRKVNTYEGIPPGVTTLALGDSGLAIAAKDKEKK
jgi:hypothetical protein